MEQGSYEQKVFKADVDFFLQFITSKTSVSKLNLNPYETEEEVSNEFYEKFYHCPCQLLESSIVSIPTNNISKPRARLSKVMNPTATRHFIYITWNDFTILPELNSYSEAECAMIVETEYLCVKFWQRVFRSILGRDCLVCSSLSEQKARRVGLFDERKKQSRQ